MFSVQYKYNGWGHLQSMAGVVCSNKHVTNHQAKAADTRHVKMLSAKMFQSPRNTLVLNVNELQVLWVSDH